MESPEAAWVAMMVTRLEKLEQDNVDLRSRLSKLEPPSEHYDVQFHTRPKDIFFEVPVYMISEAFIDANGTQCGSLRLSRLRRLLQPAASRYCLAERELTPAQKQDIMLVGAVEEVINVLGLKGPFDTAHTIEDLSSGEVRERVLNTECFKSWADMRKIFNTQASKTVWKTSSDVMGTVRVVLDSIGLAVSSKRIREREAGTGLRPHSYKYWLSTDAANNMQELLALKDGDIEKAGKWAHLLTRPVPPSATRDTEGV